MLSPPTGVVRQQWMLTHTCAQLGLEQTARMSPEHVPMLPVAHNILNPYTTVG